MESNQVQQNAPGSGTIDTDALLAGLGPEVFENANTITKWLLTQPTESLPVVAQAVFAKLFSNASESRQYHGNGHDVVRLCSFVQQCAKAQDEKLKAWAFTEPVSTKLFHFYLEWYEHDPHRALRLILDVLVASATINPSPETGKAVKEHILKTIVEIVTRKSAMQLTKSGLQCLDHFLNKKVLTLDEVARKYREVDSSVADLAHLSLWKSFVFELFSWMELPYVCPHAGKCLVHIFKGLTSQASAAQENDKFTVDVWKTWLQEAVAQRPAVLEDIKNYVLVPIFKTDKVESLKLLEAFNRSEIPVGSTQNLTDLTLLLQLATLETGKRFGLVEEPSNDIDASQSSSKVILRDTVLESFLTHPSLSVRSSAFSLLVSSQATTKPFSRIAFDLLRKHLAAFHADFDAKLRNEVLGYTKNLIRRVKNVISVAQRSLAQAAAKQNQAPADKQTTSSKKKDAPENLLKNPAEAKEVLDRHEAFLSWYLGFLKGELVPTASYQRHITAMRAALLILKVGKHAGATDDTVDEDVSESISSDFTWIRLLLDLLLDPFDDVRDSASSLLGLFSQEIIKSPARPSLNSKNQLDVLQDFCVKARTLADRTGRADHGDGAARSQGLLCRWLDGADLQIGHISKIIGGLEDKVTKAEKDLGHAAIENPVHPDFAAISYAWPVLAKETFSEAQLEAIHQLYQRVFDCAKRIWLAVKHVLCDDSPEGHLPEEMEDIEGLDTKDLLSYSFRAVHESSNLMRLMLQTLRLTPGPGVPFPPLAVFQDTGYLTFEQLSSLRHRGAFSTVSLTFTTCCQLTQNLPVVFPETAGSNTLLREWYKGTINCIMNQASTTRRSAGIPSLVAGILTANAESPSFSEVFSELEEIGKKPVTQAETDGSNLPQVHALNSLREIFKSSSLSKKAEAYLARTLQLAANNLKSEVWAIRNCGLLLLRSLIDCLLGTGESKAIIESGWDGVSVRISYNKYPTLPGVILGLLESANKALGEDAKTAAAEAVFPALDIIRRAGPPEAYRTELQGHIEAYLDSHLWHVREIAARTLCSFLLHGDWVGEIQRLLEESEDRANRIHGVLLLTRFVLERKTSLGADVSEDTSKLKVLLRRLADESNNFKTCPVVKAAYLEIFNILASIDPVANQSALELIAITPGSDSTTVMDKSKQYPSSALLDTEAVIASVYHAAAVADTKVLRALFLHTLSKDINTTQRMIEMVPAAWKSITSPEAIEGLSSLYSEVCTTAAATADIKAAAITNLGNLIDALIQQARQSELAGLPFMATVEQTWKGLQQGEINPNLSCAIIRASGSLMTALTLRSNGEIDKQMAQRLRAWGAMIADALDIDNTFDTRYAAASSLTSFFTGFVPANWSSAFLPALSALYDALIDDDDEVRDLASAAAAPVVGQQMVPPSAADRLAAWTTEMFFGEEEFQDHLVSRLTTGNSPVTDKELTSAAEQLLTAFQFDDSLFATEEQNLFIDEVRETRRWQRELIARASGSDDIASKPAFAKLSKWTEEGLKYLVRLVRANTDVPLGWSSDQHVFAACARVLLCAVAVVKVAGAESAVGEELKKFKEVGEKGGLHGSLMEIAAL
ncbi:putative death-receptor fusion protein-domain-containing protein [Sordaria brevicollis]|uniref:Death-receptor fusion protein-domain-containing protein n=1 Tax=Sordaria brevicollis TaxID=83679 RepID=A0AAE0U693_SORBR|nr:putative death-receptor fusion protein-domain-containing protein [Sordaria brevicollis]